MSADAKAGRALLVVRDTNSLSQGDNVIAMRLERLGYNVSRTEDAVADAADGNGHAVVVCSSVVGPPNLSADFLTLEVPIVVLGDSLYDDLGMTGMTAGKDYGRSQDKYAELWIGDAGHSMAAGLEGCVTVASSACQMIWARPLPDAIKIATLPGAVGDERVAVFGYEAGTELRDGKAPARRVGLFMERETVESLNNNGWALFDAAINWAVGEELKQFPEVFREEWQEIKERRLRQRIESGIEAGRSNGQKPQAAENNKQHDSPEAENTEKAEKTKKVSAEESAPENLVGLALSGGGIRSAVFCLGLLQGMHDHGLLRVFDYLSTVSGGGYLGGWWSAWLARYGHYSQSRNGYPQFAVYDIQEPARLAALFHNPKSAAAPDDRTRPAEARRVVSERVKVFFGTNYPGFLEKFHAQRKPDASDRKDFINSLNNLLLEERLFDGICEMIGADEKLPGLRKLREDITRSKVESGGGADKNLVSRFNRMLLELVYRSESRREMFPPDEKIEPVRSSRYFSEKDKPDQWAHDQKRLTEEMAETAKDIMCAGSDPVHHLRLFANYLTPRKGFLSKDTWRAIAVVTRNLVMTWITILPLLIAFVLAGQLYFAMRPAPDDVKSGIESASSKLLVYDLQRINQQIQKSFDGVQTDDIPPAFLPAPFIHDFSYPYFDEGPRLKSFAEELRKSGDRMRALERIDDARLIDEEEAQVRALEQKIKPARSAILTRRGWWAFYPLAFLLSLIVATTAAWMSRNTSGSEVLGSFGGMAFWVLIVCWLAAFITTSRDQGIAPLLFRLPAVITSYLLGLLNRDGKSFSDVLNQQGVAPGDWNALLAWGGVWGGVVLVLIAWAWWRRRDAGTEIRVDEDPETQSQWGREVQRNRTTQAHTKILIWLVVLTAVFLLAGFGHELINYVFYSRDNILAFAGGGFAVLATISGAIFTAIKASPVGGGDEKEAVRPSLVSRAVFTLTPPFLIIALALLISSLAHFVFCHIIRDPGNRFPPLTLATFVSAWLCVLLAFYEIKQRRWSTRKWLAVAATLVGVSSLIVYTLVKNEYARRPVVALWFALLGACFFVPRLAVDEARGKEDSKQRTFRIILFRYFLKDKEVSWKMLLAACVGVFLACAGIVRFFPWPVWVTAIFGASPSLKPAEAGFAGLAMLTTLVCVAFFISEIYRGAGGNRRSLWLLTCVCVAMMGVLFFGFIGGDGQAPSTYLLARAIFGLLALSLGLVIALGWLADPNALSMHQFYRDRLVRAYLGASNAARRIRLKNISDSVEGDDVLLQQMKNCQRGAPYHIINTTLNLAAGRDIATAQRSSAMFVLTKRNCGSSRTGYRGTAKYMGGRLSLGTAIAASGAAASPNMGSRTPPTSLAMLMTILNVRLGFWAPTPNKDHWQKPQPQLWPFYLLREFLSQTNELSAYSYLTDGGHFDNTGLYSLVERGCRYIVVADCGADPNPCFSDLGEAIRRCRIDFGVTIDIELKTFLKGEGGRASGHFAVGTITYSEEHARALRWKNPEGDRSGIIVVFKPSRVADEPADVQQYAIENDLFPQQTTADQWFDESQFESYRRLGQFCADTAFKSLNAIEKIRDGAGAVSLDVISGLFKEMSPVRGASNGGNGNGKAGSNGHRTPFKIDPEISKKEPIFLSL
jgi:hypothetical protein